MPRPSQWSNTSHTDNYAYDSQGRLTQAVGTPTGSGTAAENLSYAYDSYGNMTCVQNQFTNGTCAQASFDTATNHITLVGTGVPTYDTKGDLVTDGYTLNTYVYDAEGRLTNINNSQHVSVSYTYNALGQLVEDNESNWGGTDNEILYDAFGRRIADYANGTRGYGFWQNEFVPSSKPNVTYTSAPDAWDSWQGENASSQEDIGNYKGDPTTTSSSEWTQYRNQMDSKRWEAANGQNPAADSMYDPDGNDWYVCAIYGSGVSSYANFGIYCACFGPAIHPNGRPYFPRYGRWLSPDSPLLADLLDPNNLNAYGFNDGDPINDNDAAARNAEEPPSWTPDKPLPEDPKDLGPDWKENSQHQDANGEEYVNDKTGERLECNRGRPNLPGWRGTDHWHYTPPGGDRSGHYEPGDFIQKFTWGAAAAAAAAAAGAAIRIIIETAPEWVPLIP